jgi:hypothetical protein
MKFVLWQQQLVRESVDAPWMLWLDREILIEGPSKGWCEAIHIGTVDINPVCKVITINVMPFDDWMADNKKWSYGDHALSAVNALQEITERGFVNYPANTPTPWCSSWKERVAAV